MLLAVNVETMSELKLSWETILKSLRRLDDKRTFPPTLYLAYFTNSYYYEQDQLLLERCVVLRLPTLIRPLTTNTYLDSDTAK